MDYVTPSYRAAAWLARSLPRRTADRVADDLSRVAVHGSAERRLLVERNLRRILGPTLTDAEIDRLVTKSFQAYGRYWVDSFRLPEMTVAEIDWGIDYEGFEHIARAREAGYGPLVVLPHLGGWEWAGFWITRVQGIPLTAVVEPVEPQALFDFFADFRRSLGMHVVPLGPDAGTAVLRAVRDRHVICLLSDRDIEGNGVEVEFFGETTRLPAGPATLALRTGAPILPMASYFKPSGGIRCVVRPPLPVKREAKRLRDDVQRITQSIAVVLEELIRVAPEQWHVQQPNWESDYEALAAIGKPHARPGAH